MSRAQVARYWACWLLAPARRVKSSPEQPVVSADTVRRARPRRLSSGHVADPQLGVSCWVIVIVIDQPMTWTRQRTLGERDNRLSPVTRTTSSSSARATYAASYGVKLCRNSQQRMSSCRCAIRCSGSAKRSAKARSARRATNCPAMTCRRQTEAISRSISSGAARVWPRRPARAASPSELSSARAGAKMLASTTITILPQDLGRRLDRDSTAGPSACAVEDLLDRGRRCLLDQLGSQVLLK